MDMGDELVEKLILDGAVEFAGLDKDGQMLYNFTEKLEKLAPELFKLVLDTYQADIYALWELGFLSMNMDSSNPLVSATVLAYDERAVNDLPDYLRLTLSQIVSEINKRLDS
jgi:hypothetical protein